jgi:hypothetical protein
VPVGRDRPAHHHPPRDVDDLVSQIHVHARIPPLAYTISLCAH